MGARRTKSQKEARTSKMHDTNRGGSDRHSDHGGSRVTTERAPATSGLAGSIRKFLAIVRRAL